jgi:hypothetical protein
MQKTRKKQEVDYNAEIVNKLFSEENVLKRKTAM